MNRFLISTALSFALLAPVAASAAKPTPASPHVVKKSPAKRITKARIGSGTRTRGSGTRTTTFSPEVTYSNPYVNMWASFWGMK